MFQNSCIVEIEETTGFSKAKGTSPNPCNTSCSGLLLCPEQGLVLTHASALLPHLSTESEMWNKLQHRKCLSYKESYLWKHLSTRVLTTADHQDPNTLYIDRQTVRPANVSLDSGSAVSHSAMLSQPKWIQAGIELVWEVADFANVLHQLFPKSDKWKFADESNLSINGETATEELEKDSSVNNRSFLEQAEILPFFVVLRLRNWKVTNYSPVMDLQALSIISLEIGSPLLAVTSPFGSLSPPVFMNSVCRGIISNIAGSGRELILTDARCIPGAEGGPVYVQQLSPSCSDQWSLAGLVVAPLCWKANEWMGLSICCNIQTIITSLGEHVTKSRHTVGHLTRSVSISRRVDTVKHVTENVAYNVVFVHNGGSWGSGVILNRRIGLVVTCSHVVRNSETVQVGVDHPQHGRKWNTGSVIFKVPEGNVYDLALLLLKHPLDLDIPDTDVERNVHDGHVVRMVGHGIFDRRLKMAATVTSGVIAKVVYYHNHPVLIQSTCAVHAGASGGPLVSKEGKILGITTCNTRDSVTSASFPHVNMSVPMTVIAPILQEYMTTGDKKVLENLNVQVPAIENMWKLKSKDFTIKSKL